MNKILLSIIAALLLTILYGWITWPEVTTTTKTEIVRDTTTIDSLETEITKWKTVASDVTKDTIEVPTPTQVDSTTNHYEIPYSDSTLAANIGVTVEGKITESITFQYYLRRQLITEKTKTIYETRYIETQTTITNTLKPKPYLSFGLGVLLIKNHDPIATPQLSWTTKKDKRLTVGYDVINKGVYIGVSVPLKLNIPGL